jgi:type I restriction enzyme, S subunit
MQVTKPKKGYKLVMTLYGKYEEIPEKWCISNLKNLLDLLKDGTHNPPPRTMTGFPLLSSKDIHHGMIDFEKNIEFISKKDYLKMQKRYEILINDILLTVVGTLGRVSLVRNNIKFSVQRSVAILRVNKKIDSDYLYNFIQSNHFQIQMDMRKNTTAQSGIYLGQLEKITIIFPDSIQEQQKIASILLNIEDTIQKTDQIIKQTERLKRGMMQKLLLRGIRHTKFKKVDWLFGKKIEIPEEWKVNEINELVLTSKNGFTGQPNDESIGIPRLGISSISKSDTIFVHENIHRFIEIAELEIPKYQVEKNDLLVCRQNGNLNLIGKAKLIQKSITPLIFSDSLILFKINEDKIRVDFLTMFLANELARKQISKYVSTTAGNYSINGTNFKKIKILLPSLNEQKQIASILSNLDTQIHKEKLHKSNLERLKKGLMQKLLTGQIRAKV